LLGARLGEIGYLGAVRERATEGSLLFDEAEKAHPRVLDIMLQLLDAARIPVPPESVRAPVPPPGEERGEPNPN